jgi:hypothetical protein
VIGGRGQYRTADRWCVNPSPAVHRVSHGAIASWNAQFSGWFVSTLFRGLSGCVCHSWHNGGLVVRRAVAFACGLAFVARPHATVVTTGSASTTSSTTTTAASRANLIVVCTVRQRVEQMCTLERDKAYSTKY